MEFGSFPNPEMEAIAVIEIVVGKVVLLIFNRKGRKVFRKDRNESDLLY
jgi:hypothetical protein